MKVNISHISIIAVVGLLLASCSSPKSIYMGSDYGNSKYIYDKKDWPREDKQCYYWNTGKGENWYIAQNKKTGKRCVIDRKRNVIIPMKYSDIVYQNGVFKLTDDSARYCAVYDTLGQPIIDWDCKYTDISVRYELVRGNRITYFMCNKNIIRDVYGNTYDIGGYDVIYNEIKYSQEQGFRAEYNYSWEETEEYSEPYYIYYPNIGVVEKTNMTTRKTRKVRKTGTDITCLNINFDKNGHLYSWDTYKPKTTTNKSASVGSYNKERNNYTWYSTSSGTNKKGAQTSDGTTIVPAEYSKVEYVPYNDGYFVVWKDDNSGVYNNYGNNLISVDRGYSTVIKSCSDGRYYYRVCKGGRYGACDIRGREIVEPRYYHVILCDGVFLYKDDDGEWKPLNVGIDSHNRVVKDPKHTPRDKSHYEMTLEQNLLEESFGRYVGVEQMSTSANGSRAFKMVFDDKILFEFGKYDLNSSALDYIDRVASALEKLPSARVRITGYTDNIGGHESNQRLSTNRAQAVGNRLKQKGISASRIITKGVPLANYVATNDTEEGRALNRRVEIIIEPM